MKTIVFLLSGLLLFSTTAFGGDVQVDSNGTIIVGTANPDAKMEILGETDRDGILGSTTGNGAGIYGENRGSGNFGLLGDANFGVYGMSSGGFAGYFEENAHITGNLFVDGTITGMDLGDITGVTAGTGLTGGGLAGDVTLDVDFAGTGLAPSAARSDHDHPSSYAPLTHYHAGDDIQFGTVAEPYISPAIPRFADIMPTVLLNDGPGSTLNADLLDGLDQAAFARASHSHGTDYVSKNGDFMYGGLHVNTASGSAGSFTITDPANIFSALSGFTQGGGAAVYGQQQGTGRVADFRMMNPDNDVDALSVRTDGMGNGHYVYQEGKGMAGYFQVFNPSNEMTALRADTNGSGNAVWGWQKGTGRAGYFQISGASNIQPALTGETNGSGDALYGYQTGTGKAGWLRINNSANSNYALRAETNGLGSAGAFQITNAANNNFAVSGSTNGSGTAVGGFQTGTGKAGDFRILNASNGNYALYAESNGSSIGSTLYAKNTGYGMVARFEKISATGNAANVYISGNNAGRTLHIYQYGTGEGAYIEVDNTSNNKSGLSVITNGTGYSGYFEGGYGFRVVGDASVSGRFSAPIKEFVQPHPHDPSREIVYVSMEGPESVVFVRGTARLVDGRAEIETPDYFHMVASDEGITVQFTPRSSSSKGLAAVEVSRYRVGVAELMDGQGTYEFDYFISAKRAGFEEHEPVQPNTHFSADGMSRRDFERAYADTEDMSISAMRALLISNNILTREGKLNMETVSRLGWTLRETEVAQNGDEPAPGM